MQGDGGLPPDEDLAYLPEGTEHFSAYVRAVGWAQRYARLNRDQGPSEALAPLAEIVGRHTVNSGHPVGLLPTRAVRRNFR
jgi:RNA-splicing ligase RtcB